MAVPTPGEIVVPIAAPNFGINTENAAVDVYIIALFAYIKATPY